LQFDESEIEMTNSILKPNQFKRLSEGEIKILEKNGYNIHDLKQDFATTGKSKVAKFDIYKDSAGRLFLKSKTGNDYTDIEININKLK
jgi:nucleoside diphosphate kinase